MITTKQLMFLKLNNYVCKISITNLFLLCFIFSKTVVNSQIIFPANNDSLNFTEFYFEISPIQDAQEYEIVYWEEGKENEKTSLLSKNISIPVKGLKKNCNYYWQYSDLNRTKVIGPFKFFILPYKFYNLEKLNIKIFDSLPANFNDYIIIDALGAVINRNGEIIWHIPERPFYGNHRLEIRDIKLVMPEQFHY